MQEETMAPKLKSNTMGLSSSLRLHLTDDQFLGGGRIQLLEKIDELGSISRAAKALEVSYKTAWDMARTINNLAPMPLVDRLAGGKGGGRTCLTNEGKKILEQYQIVQGELQRVLDNLGSRLGDTEGLMLFLRRTTMKVSARNTFAGTVTGIINGAVNAEVTLALQGGTPLVAVVTNGAVANLGLTVGMEAYAIIKASSVIIGTELHDSKVSARNIFCGTVATIVEGPVNTEVDIEIGGGNVVSAVITHGSSENLGLKAGGHACAMFKASSVILGVGVS
jgi:molybdate transport system regulatory protein